MKQNNERPDPLIDEIRAIRREISDQFGNDVQRLGQHLQELERQHQHRVVEPPAAPPPSQQVG